MDIKGLVPRARRAGRLGAIAAMVAAGLSPVVVPAGRAVAAPAGRVAPLVSAPLAQPSRSAPAGDFRNEPALGAERFPGVTHGAPASVPVGASVDATTASSTDYVNPDGSHTLAVSAGVVNFQDAAGRWHAFDSSLSEGRDHRLKESSGVLGASAPLTTAAGAGTVLVAGGGWSLGMGLAGTAPGVAGSVTGSSVVYPSVTPGVDVAEVFGQHALESMLVVHAAPAVSSWDLNVEVSGASLVAEADGSIGVVAGGAVVGTCRVALPRIRRRRRRRRR